MTRRDDNSADADISIDPCSGAELAIETIFLRRIAALRHLARDHRDAALCAARIDRQQALDAVRERRAADRHASRQLRRLQRPAPT